jgi:hypothetical protein
LVAAAGLLGANAVKKRKDKDETDRRITGYLRNIGVIGNVPVAGPFVQPPPPDPNVKK